MKKVISLILGVLGLLLVFAGIGLTVLTQQFLLYLGGALLILALFFFLRG